nr:hypothetical protein [Tanacetum cinerariifolium]
MHPLGGAETNQTHPCCVINTERTLDSEIVVTTCHEKRQLEMMTREGGVDRVDRSGVVVYGVSGGSPEVAESWSEKMGAPEL